MELLDLIKTALIVTIATVTVAGISIVIDVVLELKGLKK